MKNKDITRIELINTIGQEFPNGKGVEVGTFKGEFSKEIMENWSGTLYMVDVWRPLSDEEYLDSSNHHNFENGVYSEAMKNINGHEDRAVMVRATSEIAANMFEDNSLDFVYIDANHAYDYVVQDINLWYPKVKEGGYLCGHDYINIDWYNDPNFSQNGKDKHIYSNNFYHGVFGVNPAVDEFCTQNKYNPQVTKEWFGSWWLKKKVDTKKIAVLVVYDDNYESMKKLTVDNNIKNYCDLHGYTLIPYKVTETERHASWYKISKSIDILKSNEFDWLFFIDLDCLIMNPTIKLESIIDERYSFIVPSHNVPAIDTPTITPFNTNNTITSQFLVKNDDMGIKILEDIWESKELPSHMDFHTFDYEGRQTRVTIIKDEFKSHVKILDEKILNRFWYMNSPFVTFHNMGVNDLVWKPGDFIVHVTGYQKEERIKLLSDLNFFSGGAIVNMESKDNKITFKPLLDLPYLKLQIKNLDGNILLEKEYHNLSSKSLFSLDLSNQPIENTIRVEGYNKINNLISLHKLDI
jgi:hypothetical protein